MWLSMVYHTLGFPSCRISTAGPRARRASGQQPGSLRGCWRMYGRPGAWTAMENLGKERGKKTWGKPEIFMV